MMILVVLCLFALTRNYLIKETLIKQIARMGDKYASVGSVNLGLFFNSFSMRDFRLHEEAFSDSPLILHVNEFSAEFNPTKISTSNPVIDKATLDCRFVRIEIDADGGSDFEWIGIKINPQTKKKRRTEKGPAEEQAETVILRESTSEATTTKPSDEFVLSIKELTIRVGKIEYIDHSRGGGTPLRMILTLDFEKQYKNINDPKELAELLRNDLVAERLGGVIPGLNL